MVGPTAPPLPPGEGAHLAGGTDGLGSEALGFLRSSGASRPWRQILDGTTRGVQRLVPLPQPPPSCFIFAESATGPHHAWGCERAFGVRIPRSLPCALLTRVP